MGEQACTFGMWRKEGRKGEGRGGVSKCVFAFLCQINFKGLGLINSCLSVFPLIQNLEGRVPLVCVCVYYLFCYTFS